MPSHKMTDIQLAVFDKAHDLSIDSRMRIVCPICGGGSDKEKSMDITRTDYNLLYICHRASCGTKGRVSMVAQSSVKQLKKPKPQPMPVIKTRALGDEEMLKLEKYLQLNTNAVNSLGILGLDKNYTRLYIPIRNKLGKKVGYELKRMPWVSKAVDRKLPKSLSYVESPELNRMSWYTRDIPTIDGALILVEDSLSAIRLHDAGVDSVSLLGTNLNTNKITEIKGMGYNTVFLSFDADATAKAINYKQRYTILLPRLHLANLRQDVKDMPKEAFAKYLESIKQRADTYAPQRKH